MINLQGKRTIVTGGNSMIGSAIINSLQKREAIVYPVLHEKCDLLHIKEIRPFFERIRPTYIVHAAGFNGGISFNRSNPADIFYQTVKMGINVLKTCQEFRVSKVLSILSSCAYPNDEILTEGNLYDGLPHPTVECHGLAKRVLCSYSKQLYKQYKLNAVCVVLQNSFGPKDVFSERGKVVGSLIRKFVLAKERNLPFVQCFGSGKPRRSFIYCQDAGECIVQSLENFENVEIPLNIGQNVDITIMELVTLIKEIVGYEGEVRWDTSKPDGQMRKLLNVGNMENYVNIEFTSLKIALEKTVSWYIQNKG